MRTHEFHYDSSSQDQYSGGGLRLEISLGGGDLGGSHERSREGPGEKGGTATDFRRVGLRRAARILERLQRDAPPGVDIFENLQRSMNMSFFEFIGFVMPGGQWDFKEEGSQYEAFGNRHFGFLAAARGWPLHVTLYGGGIVQVLVDYAPTVRNGKLTTRGSVPRPSSWGSLLPPVYPYRDEPKDARSVTEGHRGYKDIFEALNTRSPTMRSRSGLILDRTSPIAPLLEYLFGGEGQLPW